MVVQTVGTRVRGTEVLKTRRSTVRNGTLDLVSCKSTLEEGKQTKFIYLFICNPHFNFKKHYLLSGNFNTNYVLISSQEVQAQLVAV